MEERRRLMKGGVGMASIIMMAIDCPQNVNVNLRIGVVFAKETRGELGLDINDDFAIETAIPSGEHGRRKVSKGCGQRSRYSREKMS